MPEFINPAFLTGTALVASPIIIHLINRMRFRRVRWATMEFLLESQRKNRRRVLLKQLLLLLMRILIILLFVFLVARPYVGTNMLLGDEQTHDVIILDDSCSMNDRWADTSSFAQARNTVLQLAQAAASKPGTHKFTLLRLSRIGQPDLLRESIDHGALARINGIMESMEATHGVHKLLKGIKEAERLFTQDKGLNKSLHIVSDFRAHDWLTEDALAKELTLIQEGDVTLNFIRTVNEQHQNQSLMELQVLSRNVAADVPVQFVATIKNHGPGSTEAFEMGIEVSGQKLPGARLDPLPPGQSVKHPFEVRFSSPGNHVLKVSLPHDALPPDDERFMVINIRDRIPVLVLKGEAEQQVDYISYALSPGGESRTGIEPVIRSPQALNSEPLNEYPMIFVANVPKLQEAGAKALDTFVKEGGGLAIFLGNQVEAAYYNETLYADGRGLLPAPLASPRNIEQDFFGSTGRLQFETHPVFKVFEGERNPFIQAVRVTRIFSLPQEWRPGKEVSVVAQLSTGEPYVLEKRYGEGRVILFLSGLGEEWTNWPKNPSFVITMLQLQASLSRQGLSGASSDVGLPLEVNLEAQKYGKDVTIMLPAAAGERAAVRLIAAPSPDAPANLQVVFSETDFAGLYYTFLSPVATLPEKHPYAFNVNAVEGELKLITQAEFGERLRGIDFHLQNASDLRWIDAESDQHELLNLIVATLVVLLLGEQLLAYHLSYHRR